MTAARRQLFFYCSTYKTKLQTWLSTCVLVKRSDHVWMRGRSLLLRLYSDRTRPGSINQTDGSPAPNHLLLYGLFYDNLLNEHPAVWRRLETTDWDHELIRNLISSRTIGQWRRPPLVIRKNAGLRHFIIGFTVWTLTVNLICHWSNFWHQAGPSVLLVS